MELLYLFVGLIVGLGIGWTGRSIVSNRQIQEAFQAGLKAAGDIFNEIGKALNNNKEERVNE